MIDYSINALKRVSTEELRKEYRRLKILAQYQMEQLRELEEETGAPVTKSSAVGEVEMYFDPIEELERQDLIININRLNEFLKSPYSDAQKAKSIIDKNIAIWKERGVNINYSNYNKFIEFLVNQKNQALDENYDIDEIVDDFNEMDAQDMFDEFMTDKGYNFDF